MTNLYQEKFRKYLEAYFEHPEDREIYEKKDLEVITEILKTLHENKDRDVFLESLADLLWSHGTRGDEIEFVEES